MRTPRGATLAADAGVASVVLSNVAIPSVVSRVANRAAVSTPLRVGLSVVVDTIGSPWCRCLAGSDEIGGPYGAGLPFPFPALVISGEGGRKAPPRPWRLMTTNAATSTSVVSTQIGVPSAVRSGALAMLPLLASYIPFALVIGSTAADHGAALAGWAGSVLIFGGSAHLAALRTLDEAGPLAAILTGLLVNARLLVYSASLARRWPEQPRWFRLVAAGLIIDPTWAAAERHAGQCSDPRQQRRYFLAAGLTLAAGWSGAMAVGVAGRGPPRRARSPDLHPVVSARARRRGASGRQRPISDGCGGRSGASHRQLAGRRRPAGRHRGRMRHRTGQRQTRPVMTWVVVLAVGAGSFVFRLGPLLLLQRISLTERADRVLRHAGNAAITALIVVSTKNSATGTAAMPTLLAVAAGVVLAARGRLHAALSGVRRRRSTLAR